MIRRFHKRDQVAEAREPMRRSNSIFLKPGRIPKCTVQILDATEKKAKHVVKFTVYADPRRTKDVIELALIEWEKRENDA